MALRLFRHGPTAQWLGIVDVAGTATPGTAYLPDLARRYRVPVEELTVVEPVDSLPADFAANQLPVPVDPPTPEQIEQETAETLRLPTYAEIDTLIDTLFADHTAGQRTVLKRLAKLVRRLVQRHGL